MQTQPAAKIKVHHFAAMKQAQQKIAMITAYDYLTAVFANEAGFDAVLVGDSLGMVALGYNSTIPVTLDTMTHHTRAVSRGLTRPFLIADMPFMTCNISPEETLRNVTQLVQVGGAEAVKIEGGTPAVCDMIRRVVEAGIPVMGHVGLTPQSIHALGGFRIQGRTDDAAQRLLAQAKAVQEAGAFAIVIEAVDSRTATLLTSELSIATIGIGANRTCDGQILVMTDVIGMNPFTRVPKLAKKYADVGNIAVAGLKEFINEIRTAQFPSEENEYGNPATAPKADKQQ